MTILLIVQAFNLEDVFFFFFENNDNICGRRIIVATFLLSSAVLEIFLVVLILFVNLALVNSFYFTRYVSKRKISELIFPGVIILLSHWSVFLETLGINIPSA